MAPSRIRPMHLADIVPAAEMMRRGDWGDRSAFLAWAVGHASCHPLVAEVEGRVVGTGTATAYGGVGWVGTIFVETESRGRGFGRALTRAVVADLESSGCRTLLLIATDRGRRLYEGEGFSLQTEHLRLAAAGAEAGRIDPAVQPFRPEMLQAIVALDRDVNGGDRGDVLRALATPEGTQVAIGPDGSVRGFLLRGPWGGGALIAPDPDDAVRLLDWRRRRAGPEGWVATGLPGVNVAGRDRLLAEGWVEEPGATRMIRGEPLDWRPTAVWGQLSGSLG